MTSVRSGQPLAGLLLLLALAGSASAQSLVTIRFSDDSDPDSPIATGRTASVGFTLIRDALGFDAGAGLPTDFDRGTRWATATGWLQRPGSGDDPFGGLVTGGAFAYADPVLDATGWGLTSYLRGHARTTLGPVELRGIGGARAGLIASGGESLRRLIGGPGVEAAVRLGPVDIDAGVDLWLTPDGEFPELGAEARLDRERVRLRLGASHLLRGDVDRTGWLAALTLSLTDRLSLLAQAGRTATDLLFWTPARRHWSVGLRVRTGAPGGIDVVPPTVVDGRDVLFELAATAVPGRPAVAGSFSRWEPVRMTRAGERWRLRLRLEPGVHEFAFVGEDGTWFVPEETPGRKPDGYGGHVATVIVR